MMLLRYMDLMLQDSGAFRGHMFVALLVAVVAPDV